MLEKLTQSIPKTLSDHLLSTDLDLASASDWVSSVADTLNSKRNAATWNQMRWEEGKGRSLEENQC